MSDYGWRENSNGNWVLTDMGETEATVYATRQCEWGVIWNGAADGRPRHLKQKCASAEDACRAAETAMDEGEQSARWWPPHDQWQMRKGGGAFRKVNGGVVSVKQAKSGSWYAVSSAGGLLGQGGRASWFRTEEEARAAVTALASGSSDWSWCPAAP